MKKIVSLGGTAVCLLGIWACGGGSGGPSAKVTGSCTGIAAYGLNVTSATANHTGTGKFNVTIMGSVAGGPAGQTATLTFKQSAYCSPTPCILGYQFSAAAGSPTFNALYQTANPNSSVLTATDGVVSFSSYNSTTVGGLVAGLFTGLTFTGVPPADVQCTINGSFSTHTGNPAAPNQ